MKKYLAFRGEDYYPAMGLGDLVGDYDTLSEAVQAISANTDWYRQWWAIYDVEHVHTRWVSGQAGPPPSAEDVARMMDTIE